jgi:ribose 1,5-bisphosphokinase
MARGTTMANLFYVIGASGAGKDSLIRHIRQYMPDDASVLFAHRYITRPADAGGENHVALSMREFERRKELGCFAMHWFSHETHYAIGKEINVWLSHGLDVVVNGSRGYLEDAAKLFPNLVPVLISVDPNVLCDRLFARGRETAEQIEMRLIQAIQLENGVSHPHLLKIENNGLMQDAGDDLLNAILGQVKEKCA